MSYDKDTSMSEKDSKFKSSDLKTYLLHKDKSDTNTFFILIME